MNKYGEKWLVRSSFIDYSDNTTNDLQNNLINRQ